MELLTSDEIKNTHRMYGVYGSVGTGKTSIIKQHPAKKKVVITFDSSHEVLENSGIDVLVPSSEDMKNMKAKLPQSIDLLIEKGYEVIMLDNVSNLESYMLDAFKEETKDGRQAYMLMQSWFRQIAQYLNTLPVDIVATAWEQAEEHTTGISVQTYYAPMMNAKARSSFFGLFSYVGQLKLDEEGNRTITTADYNNRFAKNRLTDDETMSVEKLFTI